MPRKTLAWANKEVETFVCILGEEDVVYDVYVAAAAIDIRPTLKGYCRRWKRDLGTELGYTAPSLPDWGEPNRTAPCSGNAA